MSRYEEGTDIVPGLEQLKGQLAADPEGYGKGIDASMFVMKQCLLVSSHVTSPAACSTHELCCVVFCRNSNNSLKNAHVS